MVSDINEIKELIRQLLANSTAPELGARLKQRLQAELERRGDARFDERMYGYRKFSELLSDFPGDFEIIKSQGPGDLHVRLQPAHQAQANPLPRAAPHLSKPLPVRELPRVRNDVWQAFTNPDPRRRRFVHRANGQVHHYLEDDEDSRFNLDVASEPDRFMEINPVRPQEQLVWMREYVVALSLPDSQSMPLLRLAEGPYTSQLNSMFTSALAEHGLGWRRRRAGRVYEYIEMWANKHNVSLQILIEGPSKEVESESPSVEDLGRLVSEKPRIARERVIQLLGMLSDQDVEELVLPIMLTTLWITTRRSP